MTAANETSSWKPITDKHPDIVCTGCACHGASLLYKDIFTHAWPKKVLDDATTLMKFIKHHTWTNSKLKRDTAAAGQQKSIILHGETRFAGSYYSMKRLLEVKGVVRSMVFTDEFESKKYASQTDIQRLCQKRSFWDDLSALVAFMRPLKNFIKLMDHSYHTTHLVYPGLVDLGIRWEEMKGAVSTNFHRHCMSKFKSRMKYILFPVHYACYALSPEHHSDNIWGVDEVCVGTKQVMRIYLNLSDTNEALEQLDDFKNHQCPMLFPCDPQCQNEDDPNPTPVRAIKNPRTWWKVHGSRWPLLQQVALRIFAIGTASAPSERNFSAFGNIWNLRSYSLSSANAIKLVYIYYNLRKLFKKEVESHEGIEYGWLATLNENETSLNFDDSSDEDEPVLVTQ